MGKYIYKNNEVSLQEDLSTPVTVTLKKGEGRTVKAGGMWIFDNEIESVMGSFENGDIVKIHDFDG